jgi:type 1 glutamine amidotransferase
MKIPRLFVLAALVFASAATAQVKKIRAVILTGQHSYQNDFFTKVMDGMKDVEYKHVDLPGESEIFEDVSAWDYDVIIFYNSGQKISEKRQQNLLSLLNKGVGVVVLHHAVCAYEDWPEYKKIVGCKFHGVAEMVDGVRYESNYKEPTPVNVIIDDKADPLMQGFKDFTITDEVYTDMSYTNDYHILAHTNHALIPGKPLVWKHRYGNANVFTITLGHRAETLTGPFMGKLVPDAIRWSVASPSTSIAPPRRDVPVLSWISGTGRGLLIRARDSRRAWDAKGASLILPGK